MFFYVSLNITGILLFPNLAEFRDTAPLTSNNYIKPIYKTVV